MSTLLQTRQVVVEKSGRFELVADYEGGNYSDNGANFYIQAGQRFLDMWGESPMARHEYKIDLAIGDYIKRFAYLRSIEEVHIYSSSNNIRSKLTPLTLTEMKDKYLSFESSELDNGTPIYYCDDVVNLAPSQNIYTTIDLMEAAVLADTAPFSYDYQNILADKTYENRGVFFLPPADGVYTLSITGLFFSKFNADTDYTFWSKNFPELTVMASLLMMEVFHRNSVGVRDWMNMIEPMLRGIDMDIVRRDIAYAGNQLRG